MKILFTGGGSGGHFYPIIAIAEEINSIAEKESLVKPELYLVAPDPYDENALFQNGIEFRSAPAGKMRTYFSFLNFFDMFKTFFGILKTIWLIYSIFPDVVFGKGGYASFPTLFAARLFGIPVVIHESDSVPGRTNLWAGKFADRIAISFPASASYFPTGKVALTGNPIRANIRNVQKKGAHEFLKLEEETPVIVFLGGSQGALKINDALIDALPKLLDKYQIIHQTGREHFDEMKNTAKILLENHTYAYRYRPFAYLNELAMKMAAGAADLVVSRAGASAIFEIAQWGVPSIIIPIDKSNGNHQRKNAFTYARTGASLILEEQNLTQNVLISEINRIMEDTEGRASMSQKAKEFATPDAAEKIAREIINIALTHEE